MNETWSSASSGKETIHSIAVGDQVFVPLDEIIAMAERWRDTNLDHMKSPCDEHGCDGCHLSDFLNDFIKEIKGHE